MNSSPADKTKRRLLQSLAAISVCASSINAYAIASGTTSITKKRIVMVTWRGKTDVERGFEDYWRHRPHAPELIWRDAAQRRERLAVIAAEIVTLQPSLVYAWGTPATLGLAGTADAPNALIGQQIPLVFALVADPVAAKIVRDATGSGRALSGVSHVAPVAQQWESMRAYLSVRGVGFFYNPLEPNSLSQRAAWQALAHKQRFNVVSVPFPTRHNIAQPLSSDDISAHLAAMKDAGVNWICLGPDSFLYTQLETIATACLRAGLPSFTAVESMIASPAPVLMGLVSRFHQVGQFAAYKAEQMMNGARNVPIETLKRFSYVVRLDTANALGIYPPMRLLDYAEFLGKI